MRPALPLLSSALALLLTSGLASANESRQLGADGGCPDSVAGAGDRSPVADDDPATPAPAPAHRVEKAKPVATPRGSGGNRAAAPRWGSFLPGMFR